MIFYQKKTITIFIQKDIIMTTKKDKLNVICGLILFLLILIGGMLDTQILEEQKTKEITNYPDTVEVFLNDSIVVFN